MSAPYPLVRNFIAFSTRLGVFTSPSRSGSSPSAASRFLTRSCIVLFYMSLHGAPAFAQTADALYADRENLASARQAAASSRRFMTISPTLTLAACGPFQWTLQRAALQDGAMRD